VGDGDGVGEVDDGWPVGGDEEVVLRLGDTASKDIRCSVLAFPRQDGHADTFLCGCGLRSGGMEGGSKGGVRSGHPDGEDPRSRRKSGNQVGVGGGEPSQRCRRCGSEDGPEPSQQYCRQGSGDSGDQGGCGRHGGGDDGPEVAGCITAGGARADGSSPAGGSVTPLPQSGPAAPRPPVGPATSGPAARRWRSAAVALAGKKARAATGRGGRPGGAPQAL
jgi:hypothetical protein